jgi:hypothetical protein
VDVNLAAGWSRGYLEFLVGTSQHPASGGRPAGKYNLSYRFTPGGTASRTASGDRGIVVIPVTSAWQTVTVTPSDDIAALWPDLDHRDFSLWNLTFSAVSTGDLVSGSMAFLQFTRAISGQAFVAQQQDMMPALQAAYPGVTQIQGSECGPAMPHVNWFGGNVTLPSYTGVTNVAAYMQSTVIPQIHGAGGLASYNHPFGTTGGPLFSPAQQDATLASVATSLLRSGVLGADLLEVGYPLRAHMDLAHHLGLWNVLSRNAMFVTGNGVSDDHSGNNWAGFLNNWVTTAWAPSTRLSDLLAALAAGQAWFGSLSAFPTSAGASLNLAVDGTCPMGSVSLSSLPSRTLDVTATGVPAGGSVAVLQGAVDYAGTAAPSDNTTTVASFTAAELVAAGGQVTLPVDTTAESFALLRVADASGTVQALSNPAWMLRNTPPQGIPAARQC